MLILSEAIIVPPESTVLILSEAIFDPPMINSVDPLRGDCWLTPLQIFLFLIFNTRKPFFKANCLLASWSFQQSFPAGPSRGRGYLGTQALLPRSFQQSFPAGPSGGGYPGPSFPGPSSSPSQLVLLGKGGEGYLGPHSQVLPAVLPSWSFWGVPCDLSHDAWALLPRSFQQSFPSGPSGGSHMTYPIMHLMLPVCSPDTNWWVWLDAAAYILLGPPPPRIELDRLTDKHVWKHYLRANYVCGW